MKPRVRQHPDAPLPADHRRGRAGRHASLAVTVLLAIVLGALGGYGLGVAAQIAREPTTPGTRPADAGSDPTARQRRSAGATPAPSAPTAPSVPVAGTGRFAAAPGAGARIGGRGTLVRFQVVVEIVDGAPAHGGAVVDPAAFAAAVEGTLADRRSWTAGGGWSFQRVASDAGADLVVHLTTPQTTDRLCGQYGLDTAGEVSCRGGRNVMINLKRWQLAVPWYADALDEYRHMVINHEIGHFLGHGHSSCPGQGQAAPVMQTQTYGLESCVRNPWPYPDGAHYLG